jgi:hypothetical protein
VAYLVANAREAAIREELE